MRRVLLALLIVIAPASGCADNDATNKGGPESSASPPMSATTGVDPTPENQYGVPSNEFEPNDIERANSAPQAVKDYCDGAVSEAQYVGCISHVDESDLP